MKTALSIKKTVLPDFRFISYTAWQKYLNNYLKPTLKKQILK